MNQSSQSRIQIGIQCPDIIGNEPGRAAVRGPDLRADRALRGHARVHEEGGRHGGRAVLRVAQPPLSGLQELHRPPALSLALARLHLKERIVEAGQKPLDPKTIQGQALGLAQLVLQRDHNPAGLNPDPKGHEPRGQSVLPQDEGRLLPVHHGIHLRGGQHQGGQ